MSKPNHTLYNCCPDALPPDWSIFDGVEIMPIGIVDPEDYCGLQSVEPVDEPWEADFWTVYGHLKEGGVECITDVSTRKLAETIGDIFMDLIYAGSKRQ